MLSYRLSLLSLLATMVLACSGKEPAGNNNTTNTTSTDSTSADESADGGSNATGAGGSSTGRSTSGGGTRPPSCDVRPILQTSCSGLACHGSPGQPAKYYTDFFNPPAGKSLEETLLGKAADYSIVSSSGSCPVDDPELLINPEAPDESLMLKKIQGTHACGLKMPNSKSELTQEQIDCFADWVNAITADSGAGGSTNNAGGSGGSTARSNSASGGTWSTRSGSGGNTRGSGAGGTTSLGSASTTTGGVSTKTTNDIAPTFETVKTILTENVTSCVGSDCHGGHQGRLDLRVNEGLLGRLTSSSSDLCGMPIVDPGQPNNSALVKLLREGCGDVGANCRVGTECIPRMPIGCTEGTDCIPEEYIKAVEQWIQDGAEP